MIILSKLLACLTRKSPAVTSGLFFEPLEQRDVYRCSSDGGDSNAPTGSGGQPGINDIDHSHYDTSKVEDGFDIEMSKDGVNFSQVGTAAPNASSFLNIGLVMGT